MLAALWAVVALSAGAAAATVTSIVIRPPLPWTTPSAVALQITVEARDASNQIVTLGIVQSVTIVVNNSQLYQPGPIERRVLGLVGGRATFTLVPAMAGQILLSLSNGPVGVNIASTGIARFAAVLPTASTVKVSDQPLVGKTWISTNVTFSTISACAALTTAAVQQMVVALAAGLPTPRASAALLSVQCGGASLPYLAAEINGVAPVGAGSVTLALRVEVSSDEAVLPMHRRFGVYITGGLFLADLQAQLPGLFAGAVTTVAPGSAPVVMVGGIACVADSWSPWSPCPLACADGSLATGVSSRVRRCPPDAQTSACLPATFCPVAGSCNVDNGGCLAFAVCSDAGGGLVSCTCPVGMLGDGRLACVAVQLDTLSVVIVFSGNLSSVAPTLADQANLVAWLVEQVSASLGIQDSRVAFPALAAASDTEYTFTFTVLAPSQTTDAQGAALLAPLLTKESLTLTGTGGATLTITRVKSKVLSGDSAAGSSASTGSTWSDTDSLALIIGLCVTVVVALAALSAKVAVQVAHSEGSVPPDYAVSAAIAKQDAVR